MAMQTSRGGATKVKLEYRLQPTRKAKQLLVIPVVLMVYLIYSGFSIMRGFHPADPARYQFGLPPMVLALGIAGTLVTISRKMVGGKITLTPTGLEWDPGRHDLNIHFPWGDLIYSAPSGPQQMVRTLQLVHRDKKLLLYDFMVPGFNQLVREVDRRVKHGRKNAGGLAIDSGRVRS